MAKKTDKQVYKDAVAEFRRKHYVDEMETNLLVAKEIRDNPEASARDRNEAVKTIARMLGGLAPDRAVASKTEEKSTTQAVVSLSDSDEQLVRDIISDKYVDPETTT